MSAKLKPIFDRIKNIFELFYSLGESAIVDESANDAGEYAANKAADKVFSDDVKYNDEIFEKSIIAAEAYARRGRLRLNDHRSPSLPSNAAGLISNDIAVADRAAPPPPKQRLLDEAAAKEAGADKPAPTAKRTATKKKAAKRLRS